MQDAMRWPHEIRRSTPEMPPPVEISDAEIERALGLMDIMSHESLDDPEFTHETKEQPCHRRNSPRRIRCRRRAI